jgi:hypothetical protein
LAIPSELASPAWSEESLDWKMSAGNKDSKDASVATQSLGAQALLPCHPERSAAKSKDLSLYD